MTFARQQSQESMIAFSGADMNRMMVMFRHGRDTLELAGIFRTTEARIVSAMYRFREGAR